MGLIADIHADRWMSSSMFVPAWGSMRTRRPILIAFRYVCLCVYPLGDPGSTVSHLTEGHPQKSKDLIRRPRDHGVHGPQDPPTSSASSFHDVQKLRNIRGFRSAGAERGGVSNPRHSMYGIMPTLTPGQPPLSGIHMPHGVSWSRESPIGPPIVSHGAARVPRHHLSSCTDTATSRHGVLGLPVELELRFCGGSMFVFCGS